MSFCLKLATFVKKVNLSKTACATVLLLEIGVKKLCATLNLLEIGDVCDKAKNCPKLSAQLSLFLKSATFNKMLNLVQITVRNYPFARINIQSYSICCLLQIGENTLRNGAVAWNWLHITPRNCCFAWNWRRNTLRNGRCSWNRRLFANS